MSRRGGIGLLLALLGIAGCATAPMERVATQLSPNGQVVTIEMVRFTFHPDLITLRAGVPLAVAAVSNSRIPHNITILSPDGQVMKRVEIPANQTVAFDVSLPRPGRYAFYCDKAFHRWPFGMEGTLVAQ